MKTRSNSFPAIIVLLGVCLMLAGCYQELYTDLPEQQINEMMALLVNAGIACQKKAGLEGAWNLRVDGDKITRAMRLLRENGFPREEFENMGRVFEKKGLISSPTEERIRFIFALSQEISSTLARIDGVLDARVHIVLPENDPFADKLIPSSASVFIKQKPGVDLESQTTKIKELVVNAIEGLEFKNVAVALFQTSADEDKKSPNLYVNMLGFKLAPESASRFRWLMVLMVSFAGSGMLAASIVVYRNKSRRSDLQQLYSHLRQKVSATKKSS